MLDPYRPRHIRLLELWRFPGWALKVYGIAWKDMPGPGLVAAAKRVAQDRIMTSAVHESHYGVGFLGVHADKLGNLVFVDWWADEHHLHHHVYSSPLDQPEALEYRTPAGLAASVWDLEVVAHERDAWVEHVLRRPKTWRLEAYLADALDTGPRPKGRFALPQE